ncbi:G patch domain-containing protein 1 [Orchesella cincta]|uniref:G patch domain-containing protein 1 n=1 Tax=Orchesella cincta TaxID=48709 RepID=A0A1D2MSA7_ORCCI|nr:G patch domain-containing protein 1 [Orchesella cincta]
MIQQKLMDVPYLQNSAKMRMILITRWMIFIDAEALLAPDDVRSLLCNPKQNTFGLGYKGLDRNTLTPASGHVDLFGSKLKFRVENKNLSISGQAFGVGAFEDHDEDIYSREDMSQYDFALETPEERRRRRAKEEHDKRREKNKENCIDGFRISSSAAKLKRKHYSAPTLPENFEPYHISKKSRFEATSTNEEKQEVAAKGLSRHNLTISERQVLIEDDPSKIKENSKRH